MKKFLVTLFVVSSFLGGSVFADQPHFGALPQQNPTPPAPQAAGYSGGYYVCPAGWTLVQSEQQVTYYVIVGYRAQTGPFGRIWSYVPVYQAVTRLVPANYCVPGVIVQTPLAGAAAPQK